MSSLGARREAVIMTALPAAGGVATEARTIIDAPADRVAALAADPARFPQLLPAEQAQVIGSEGQKLLVQVVMHEPWPVGRIRWTETVARRVEGPTYVVERQAVDKGYFRRLLATWRVTPLSQARCQVSYQVSLELSRWVPAWMLRRGNDSGIAGTVERLRRLVATP